MIKHLESRGLVAACWNDTPRIDAVKANEAPPELLEGPPVNIPALTLELADPLRYARTALRSNLRSTVFQPVAPQIGAEPPDGSSIQFVKERRYNYAAVRRGNHWETTSTTDLGSIDRVMSWRDLVPRVRAFEITTAWDWIIDARDDPRVLEHLAVVRLTIAGPYLAAIQVCDDYDEAGRWYTTISDGLAERLPVGSTASWPEITWHSQYIQVVTEWARAL